MKTQNGPSSKAYVIRGALYLFLLLSAFVIRLALGQQNITDSAIDPTKSSFAVGHAISGSTEAQPSPVAAATAVIVWDQYNNAGTAVTLSDTFTDAPAMNSDLADDFVVQDYGWIVRWIDVDGAYFNGPGPANTFTVYFYSDNDGFPGNQIYATFAWWEQNGSTFRVHVCDKPPCQGQPFLYPGRYWIEIQANMTEGCCGEWGWTDRTVTDLTPAVWRNPSGFFGACTSWSRRAAKCGLDSSAPDQVYRIYANLIPTPTATATPPSTPTPTATVTATATVPPSPTPTPSVCFLFISDPDCGSVINTPPVDFTVILSDPTDPSNVQPTDFMVNGTPADSDMIFNNYRIVFHFNTSPAVQGLNVMEIPACAFKCRIGCTPEFTCTFTYEPSTPAPTPTPTPEPRSTPVPRSRPTPAPRP